MPKIVCRKDMFSILYPSMLARDDIKNVIKVEEARVPVIKFEMDGFEFDLAMAVFKSLNTLPEEFDVTHDMHLKHVAGGQLLQTYQSVGGNQDMGRHVTNVTRDVHGEGRGGQQGGAQKSRLYDYQPSWLI